MEFEYNRYLVEKLNVEKLKQFDIKEVYYEYLDKGEKGKLAIDDAIELHYEVIMESAKTMDEAFEYLKALEEHIEYTLKQYTKCIAKSTKNYFKFLMETYIRRLSQMIRTSDLEWEEDEDE